MKSKIFLAIIGTIFTSLILTTGALALTAGSSAGPDITNEIGITSMSVLLLRVEDVVKWVYTIFFILAVLFILMAAFTYLTSAGDEEKVKSAKNQIIYAAVAIAVALLSIGLKSIVTTFLTSGQ